ncbi:hypothetical protein F4825DRAFT_447179 [Nemania diffusa]|nr:hypothetical protein F4825DRAFT_447179 [Nemania diffusa]
MRKEVTFHSPVTTRGFPEPENLPTSENNSDIDSTRAEVGTDDGFNESAPTGPQAKEKMTSTDDSSDAPPEWTRDEDRTICVGKAEAKSWAEIGQELERSRRECQQRYRTLASHARELGITADKLANLYINEGEVKTKSKKSSKNKYEDEDEDESDEPKTKKGKCKPKAKAKHGEEEEPQKRKDKGRNTAKLDSKLESTPKGKKNKHENVTPETSSSDSDSESDSSPNPTSDSEEEDLEAEYWAQRRYVYDTLHSQMYPEQKVLRPDRFYSESDCRVLAGLEARHRANKWLHIQADFCNATGRMVEAELLRAKFYENRE